MSYDDEEVLDDDLDTLDTFEDEEGEMKFKDEFDDEDPEDKFH